jgi:hypothetical protein
MTTPGFLQAYTDKTNAVLLKLSRDPATKYLADMDIDSLLTELDAVDDEMDRSVLRNKCEEPIRIQ